MNHIARIHLPVPRIFTILTALWDLPLSLQTEDGARLQSTASANAGYFLFYFIFKSCGFNIFENNTPETQTLAPDRK